MSKYSIPPPTDQQLIYIFCSELETNNTGHLDFSKNEGVHDPRLWSRRVTTVECNSDVHHMEMAIKDLLTKGAVRDVKPQDDQFTPTLFLVQKKNGDYQPFINLCALNRLLGKESFKMEGLQVLKSLI